ncbi:hypothetical protein PV328_007862 [Microctonus aethiopoides]|uniref:Tetraspanin n=1 Tax=Microctonus aethiopoides TaxID=144406 RepID=A0AA39F1J9_9HYME|nr:hypothetical protein PV328_007862 [Microctonus aethiopoides]
MKNYQIGISLKNVHILACIFLIAIAILVFLDVLIIQSNIISLKPYLKFHVSKPLSLLLLGSILLIGTGFLGILSGINNWRAGLQTFVIIIFCMFISMVGLSIVFYCTSKTADDAMYYRLTEHIRNYSINSYDLDNVQLHLSCCGVSNFIDWNETLGFIPGSCCNSNTTCNFDNIVLHRDGCYSALKAFLDNYTEKIIIVLTIIGFIETNLVSNIDTRICVVIVSIVSSLLLVYSLKNKGHEESETDEQSVQIPRINNPLGQVTPDPNSSSLSFVIGNVPEDNYRFPTYNYVRRPSERNFIINHRNRHENYLQSPPQQRYDRRIFQSIPKRMNISIYNSQK